MMRLLPGVLILSAAMARESEVMRRFATGMNGDEDLGEDILMKGEPFHYAEGKKTGEKGGKLVSKKALKKQLKKMVKDAAKIEKKLKKLRKKCDRRRFATGMNGDEDLGEDILMKGEPFHYAEGKSYEEVEKKIKGMFNGKSKKWLKKKFDKVDLDIVKMKREYRKKAKECGY